MDHTGFYEIPYVWKKEASAMSILWSGCMFPGLWGSLGEIKDKIHSSSESQVQCLALAA